MAILVFSSATSGCRTRLAGRVLSLLRPRGPEKKSEPTKAALPGSQTFALSVAEPVAPAGGTSAPAKQPGVAPVPPA